MKLDCLLGSTDPVSSVQIELSGTPTRSYFYSGINHCEQAEAITKGTGQLPSQLVRLRTASPQQRGCRGIRVSSYPRRFTT